MFELLAALYAGGCLSLAGTVWCGAVEIAATHPRLSNATAAILFVTLWPVAIPVAMVTAGGDA